MNGNVVLVKPEGGVSTAAAYRAFDEHPTVISEADREAALEAQRAAFADAGRVAAEARMRGWWARATMFGSARAAVVPNR